VLHRAGVVVRMKSAIGLALECAVLFFVGIILFDKGLEYEQGDRIALLIALSGFALVAYGFVLVLDSPVFWHLISP
jgi:drug/metabolite transporter (DMT)-like permease